MGIPPITLFLLVVTVATSLAAFSDSKLFTRLTFDPFLIAHRGQWYRFITGAFVHANWLHLIFNMWALYVFGAVAEAGIFPALCEYTYADEKDEKGRILFAIMYLLGIIFSSTYSYYKHKDNPHYSAVGASGAVSAIIMPYVLYAPTHPLLFFFIPMPSALFAILYLTMSWYMAKREDQMIGHDAHFWGAVFGLVFTIVMNIAIGGPSIIKHFFAELGIYI
jgi:membrane associated rhomboid family serine protease